MKQLLSIVLMLSLLWMGCDTRSTSPGITDEEILIGNIQDLSGPIKELGLLIPAGSQLYFDYVNACRLLASHLLRFSHLEDLLSFQYLSFLINMQADFADFHRNMIKMSALKPCLLS